MQLPKIAKLICFSVFASFPGIVPNVRGRVLSDPPGDTQFERGLYVCGWLKRGPTGIVATNLYCAEETVSLSATLHLSYQIFVHLSEEKQRIVCEQQHSSC